MDLKDLIKKDIKKDELITARITKEQRKKIDDNNIPISELIRKSIDDLKIKGGKK